MTHIETEATRLAEEWKNDPRWEGVERDYTAAEVVRLRGSIREQNTLAYRMAEKLWELLGHDDYVNLGWFQRDLGDGDRVRGIAAFTPLASLPGWDDSGYWRYALGACVDEGETDAIVFESAGGGGDTIWARVRPGCCCVARFARPARPRSTSISRRVLSTA